MQNGGGINESFLQFILRNLPISRLSHVNSKLLPKRYRINRIENVISLDLGSYSFGGGLKRYTRKNCSKIFMLILS